MPLSPARVRNVIRTLHIGSGPTTMDLVEYTDPTGAAVADLTDLLSELSGTQYQSPVSTALSTGVHRHCENPVYFDPIDRYYTTLQDLSKGLDEGFRKYVPKFIAGQNAKGSRGFIMEHLDGFYSLAEVQRAYPNGIDPRDAAWMWRRALAAVHATNEVGFTHCALNAEHVMIHPEQHGLCVVDWSYSKGVHDDIGFRPPPSPFIAPEMSDISYGPIGETTDVYAVAKLMVWLIKPDLLPTQLRAYVTACTQPRPGDRPSAAEALTHFDELIERLWGKRQFRPFAMP